MRPRKRATTDAGDLFRARLDQIINMQHELVQLAAKLDWEWLDRQIAPLYSEQGRPGTYIESRFVIGLLLLKHIFALSDEEVCDRWVYDPYFQHFTGDEFFQLAQAPRQARHLQQVLAAYSRYYNQTRTHLSLDKMPRSVDIRDSTP